MNDLSAGSGYPADRVHARARRRSLANRVFHISLLIPGILVFVPLFLIVFHVVVNGVGALNLDFITKRQRPFGEPGGGILQAIIGSVMIIAMSTIVAVPIGVAVGVQLSQLRKGRLSSALRTVIGVLQAVPSIVIGIVMYAWVVVTMGRFSAFAGSLALAIMMIPVVVNSTEEVLRLVPGSLREGALALGAPEWRAVLGVVLPAGLPGILGGIGLAISRIAGETAPLLFTAFGNPFVNLNVMRPMSAIPLVIYEYAKSPYEDWVQKAWGAALILMVVVLGLNLAGRYLKEHLHR